MLSACRDSVPPKIEICTLDGMGGGECVLADGTRQYRVPSEMANYWATNQVDMERFAGWCYDTNIKTVRTAMRMQREKLDATE